jgi:hypothetical protein
LKRAYYQRKWSLNYNLNIGSFPEHFSLGIR